MQSKVTYSFFYDSASRWPDLLRKGSDELGFQGEDENDGNGSGGCHSNGGGVNRRRWSRWVSSENEVVLGFAIVIDEFHGYARVSSEKDLIVCNGKGSALMKM
jgi:hypothetical protein